MKRLIVPYTKNQFKPYLLRKPLLVVYTILLLAVNTFSVLGQGSVGIAEASSITSRRLIQATNDVRVRYGLNELEVSPQLTAAAYAKANNMFEQQYWDHYGPNGETPWKFIKGAGYFYHFAGENLAKGFQTAEGVHQAWMASPTHRQNIISGEYKDIGIAVVQGKLFDENVTLVVQMFGNLTSEVQDVSDLTMSDIPQQEQKEDGDIKSISIKSPVQGATLKDSKVSVSGTVQGVNEEVENNIVVFQLETDQKNQDYKKVLAETNILDDNVWKVTQQYDWSDGQHRVIAVLNEDENLSDSVTFTVDATAPQIMKDTISIDAGENDVSISVSVYDQDPIVTLIVDSDTYVMEKNDIGLYETHFPGKDSYNKVSILAVDAVGNMSIMDITKQINIKMESKVSNMVFGKVLGTMSEIPSFAGHMDRKSIFNLGFGMFLLILLSVEVYYYKKHEQLAMRAYSLFMIGIWLVLLMSAMFIGFTGDVV